MSTKSRPRTARGSKISERVVQFRDAWSCTGAALLALCFFGSSLYIASKRLFWFDEIATVLVARLPSVPTMWDALVGGADLLPLPYYLLVRFSETMFGRGELAARLPSLVAVTIGLLVTFDSARRITNGLHGLIAQTLLMCSFLPFYGYEARPYGILFMFSALLIWSWLSGDRATVRTAAASGLTMFTATLFHYYAILCLVPLAAHDALHLRRPSRSLLATCLGSGFALILLFPQVLVGHHTGGSGNFWARPSLSKLQYIVPDFFPTGMFLASLVILLVVVARHQSAVAPPSDAERLGWYFLLIPFAGYILAVFVTGAFYNRYMIGTLPGVAVAFACLMQRYFGNYRLVPCGVVVLFAAFGIVHLFSKVRNPDRIESFGDQQRATRELIAWENRFLQDGKPYTAVAVGNLVWLEAWFYSRHPERYIAVLERSDSAWALGRYYPLMRFWTLNDLKRHARECAIALSIPGGLQSINDSDNISVTLRMEEPVKIYYVKYLK